MYVFYFSLNISILCYSTWNKPCFQCFFFSFLFEDLEWGFYYSHSKIKTKPLGFQAGAGRHQWLIGLLCCNRAGDGMVDAFYGGRERGSSFQVCRGLSHCKVKLPHFWPLLPLKFSPTPGSSLFTPFSFILFWRCLQSTSQTLNVCPHLGVTMKTICCMCSRLAKKRCYYLSH